MYPIINFGLLQIPTFHLIISISISIALLYLSYLVNQNKNYPRKIAFDLALLSMFTGFIGGRLLHIIYEAPQYYLKFPSQVFQFWNGGFVYYGGLITAIFACFLFLKTKKENFYHWADFMIPVFSLSYAFGRLACFFQGCCFGQYTDAFWSVGSRHPTQLYIVFAEFTVLFLILKLKNKFKNQINSSGVIFNSWVFLHSLSRLIIEFYRDDDRGFMLLNNISISQIISLFLMIISLYFLKKIQIKEASNI